MLGLFKLDLRKLQLQQPGEGRTSLAPQTKPTAPPIPRGDGHFAALTGFRFLLALWVILHHLTGPRQPLGIQALSLPHPVYQVVRGGYLAVQTFFVLSGFVLAHGYAHARWNGQKVRQYFLGRVARVYPVYLLSLVVVAPFIVADRTPRKPLYLAAHGLLAQAWLGPDPVNWNTPAWSLSCEAFFYTIFPLAVLLVRKPRWRTAIAIGVGACFLTPLMYAAGIPDAIKPLVHLSDFLIGIAAASAFELLRRRGGQPAGPWVYLPALAVAITLIGWPGLLPEWFGMNNALRPVNAVLVIGLALGGGGLARALSSGVAVYLGKSSYAMYILHIPIMWWYLHRGGELSPVLYVSLVIGISALVYSFYEEPANRWLRRRA